MNETQRPLCSRKYCASWKDGKCLSLTVSKFRGKECPFFKTPKQNEEENAAILDRLKAIGRGDLIELYHCQRSHRKKE